MDTTSNDVEQLMGEHCALLRHYGRMQSRCGELVGSQALELAALRAQAMRLRAAVIVRETALAWEREARAELEMRIPGLPRRVALAHRVDHLLGRVQELMRERLHWQWRRAMETGPTPLQKPLADTMPAPDAIAAIVDAPGSEGDTAGFEASLVAADLVICQTGCLSHDAYWRVQDHCKRTGKACVMVEQPNAVRIVRIHESPSGRTPVPAASPADADG